MGKATTSGHDGSRPDLRYPRTAWRVSGVLAAVAILSGFGGRIVLAGDDPFAELRAAPIDRILICDSHMNPTTGEGVVWIRDSAEIGELLAPIEPDKGGMFLCGYHHDLLFFSGARLVRTHRLNTECKDYVVEDRVHSFRYAGKLTERWRPYIARLTTSTRQWDVDVFFPASVPLASARAAVQSAGMDFVPLGIDDRAWIAIRLPKPIKSGSGRGQNLPAWLRGAEETADAQSDPFEPTPSQVAKVARLLGKACAKARCAIDRVDESEVFSGQGWETWIGGFTVGFESQADFDAFSKYARSRRWKVAESHAKPTEYAVTIIVDERPTDGSLEQIRKRIPGAKSARPGELRLRPGEVP
jgi:hypothetical protein